jgi:synaptobrevin family protein YKT6
LIAKALDEFMKVYGANLEELTKDSNLVLDPLDQLLGKFQNPQEADSVMKIQKVRWSKIKMFTLLKDLDDTKEVLVKSIDQILLRGEKLDVLAEKSQDLSFQVSFNLIFIL